MIKCPRCASQQVCKNGHRNGRQCHLCRECGYQFTNMAYRERPVWEKLLASLVHALGVSPADIAQLFKTSTSSVLRWRVLGRGSRTEDRSVVREKPVLIGVGRLRELLDAGEEEAPAGRKPLVLIVDEKNQDKVVGIIVRD